MPDGHIAGPDDGRQSGIDDASGQVRRIGLEVSFGLIDDDLEPGRFAFPHNISEGISLYQGLLPNMLGPHKSRTPDSNPRHVPLFPVPQMP